MTAQASARVVVVSWNTAELLRECLQSLREPAERGELELVVVDNDSSDGSAELVEREFGNLVRLIRSGSNLGFGRAAMLGTDGAQTPWLAICNADIKVPSDAISRLIAAAGEDRGVGLLAPRLEDPHGQRQESVFRFPRLSLTLLAALGVHRIGPAIQTWMFRSPLWHPSCSSDIEWAMGAFLLVRRDAFEQVGGFAADQWMYAEDLDLQWRLQRAGLRRRYVCDAPVVHVGGAAAATAFGASAGTTEVARAYYHWLRTRLGLGHMLLFACLNLTGIGVRVVAYRVLVATGRGSAAYAGAVAWLKTTARGLHAASRSRA